MKKRAISILLAFVMLFSFTVTALADGDPNVDGGGGGMGSGTSTDSWTPGMDGVRVSIVNVETGAVMGTPIDYTNKTPASSIIHFGKKSKLHYTNGSSLAPAVGGVYNYKNPSSAMPTVVSSNGSNNIEAVKRYFCSEYVTHMIATDFGIQYDTLINGKYKLLLEPIAYFKFQGNQVGMTAHEAALYDQQLSGGLRSKMASLSHQNLPLAMFLERPELGFPAYSGDTSGRQSNDTILAYLGMGIVSYTELPPDDPDPGQADVEYRINTEVITAVTLNASREINPDNPARVTFTILGRTYTMSNIVIPEGESQVVWCKWTTPATEQTITITVSTNKGYLSENVITAKIVDLNKNPPPDPKADDRNDSFHAVSIPSKPQKTSARWTVWWATWHAFWEWEADWVWYDNWVNEPYQVYVSSGYYRSYTYTVNGVTYTGSYWVDTSHWETRYNRVNRGYWVDEGEWVDNGWYDFFTDIYTASLTASSTVTPDSKVPTASGNTMKSGYGVNNKVTSSFSSNAPNSHVTGAQTAVSYFPEFKYATYWRLLDLITRGYSSQLEFKKNEYSTYNQRAHFSPVWYPNGTYQVYTYLMDAWTPDGMLSMNLNSSVSIQGSVFDDWHIAPK